MRSELQFFMTQNDEEEFISFFKDYADSIDKESNLQWFFYLENCPIQFLRSRLIDNQLISGRISIATHGFGLQYKSNKRVEKLYSKMSRWFKKCYNNRLTVENTTINNSRREISRYWVSKRVIALKKVNKNLTLRQILDAPVIFEILD